MTLTADTITDEQIRELRKSGERMMGAAVSVEQLRASAFDVLLVTYNALSRNADTSDAAGTHTHWRARCAEILNARSAK